eukprot:44526-Prorocentrum_minimum.AAC.2
MMMQPSHTHVRSNVFGCRGIWETLGWASIPLHIPFENNSSASSSLAVSLRPPSISTFVSLAFSSVVAQPPREHNSLKCSLDNQITPGVYQSTRTTAQL